MTDSSIRETPDPNLTSPFASGPGAELIVFDPEAVLRDYRVAVRSRHTSIVGRQEVLTGKAKFGIFGDGKEVAQLAMAYAFKKGDFRSGYYRDQTFMFALGATSVQEFFAQLYAHADLEAEPAFGGRSMTGHFATRLLRPDGAFVNLLEQYNSSADLSPTAAQMPRLVGLAYASRLYRELEILAPVAPGFSDDGNEVAFGTIGNASCAEGVFWEAVNAAGVLQIPLLISIWDDGYGISVPNKFQMTKGDMSSLLRGFERRPGGRPGLDIYTVVGWDYEQLCQTYWYAAEICRRDHVPAIVHVTELTQPLGHSTSGSHERYKSAERLEWEREFDCVRQMRKWIVAQEIATDEELDRIEEEEKRAVVEARDRAWEAYRSPLLAERDELLQLAAQVQEAVDEPERKERLQAASRSLATRTSLNRRDLLATSHLLLTLVRDSKGPERDQLAGWHTAQLERNRDRYGSDLYSSTSESALLVPEILPSYSDSSPQQSGFEILNACFDAAFARHPELVAMGEDVGRLGDVNQGFAHLQEKYGQLRVSDTGIRESTILGQAIGLALRGLHPIAEIQYLDYILYALQIMADDLATLRWRTRGGQKAPVIIRTRGHRLEGIWHSGSPMAGVLNFVRGIYVCVPRDATQAAGFYNTMLRSDDAALIVEVLNAYRKKALLPDNIGEICVPLGVPEVLREGSDVTVVTYGACCAIAAAAAEELAELGIDVELVDVRTLLPFDTEGVIGHSLRKTNRVLFLDEDVPGGTTAYMMQKVIEEQNGYDWLDSRPRTLSASEHRPAYGNDGDYFSKPNQEQIFDAVYEIMHEADPRRFPSLYR